MCSERWEENERMRSDGNRVTAQGLDSYGSEAIYSLGVVKAGAGHRMGAE